MVEKKCTWYLYFDGGCRIREGRRHGAGGWVVAKPDGSIIVGSAVYFGTAAPTNNAAEVRALRVALEEVARGGYTAGLPIEVRGDSELVIKFLNREAVAKK